MNTSSLTIAVQTIHWKSLQAICEGWILASLFITMRNLLRVIENRNIAFSLISPGANIAKWFPRMTISSRILLSRTVGRRRGKSFVGIVGSYQLSGSIVKWQGFPYPKAVLPGREICRQIFLGGDPTFGFGTPTSLLYRADLVRKSGAFYPNASPHADTSACFKYLKDSDFGFVYQVLSYERTHGETQTSKSAEINRYASAYLDDLIQYGPSYLSKEEFEHQVERRPQ